jgi:hypothetical protein
VTPSNRIACLIGSTLIFSSALAQITDPKLYASIVDGSVEELKTYLSAGGSPSTKINVPGSNSTIALLDLAVRSSKEDPALVLLNSGASPDNITEFVEVAAEKGFANVLTQVLDRNPAVVLQMRTANHPLFLAIAHGHYDAVSTLLDRMKLLGGAEREAILNEALLVATNNFDAKSGQAIVGDLLKAGADPVGTPALAVAVSTCAPNLVSTLLAAGADVKKRYDVGGGATSLAQYAVRCFDRAPEAAEGVLEALVAAGADLCAVDWTDMGLTQSALAHRSEIEQSCKEASSRQ